MGGWRQACMKKHFIYHFTYLGDRTGSCSRRRNCSLLGSPAFTGTIWLKSPQF